MEILQSLLLLIIAGLIFTAVKLLRQLISSVENRITKIEVQISRLMALIRSNSIALPDSSNAGVDDEEMYQEAYELVTKMKAVSTSDLQRKLNIGYSRAARLIDMLEDRGVVGPAEGANKREIFER